jgi:hypothetical protein
LIADSVTDLSNFANTLIDEKPGYERNFRKKLLEQIVPTYEEAEKVGLHSCGLLELRF